MLFFFTPSRTRSCRGDKTVKCKNPYNKHFACSLRSSERNVETYIQIGIGIARHRRSEQMPATLMSIRVCGVYGHLDNVLRRTSHSRMQEIISDDGTGKRVSECCYELCRCYRNWLRCIGFHFDIFSSAWTTDSYVIYVSTSWHMRNKWEILSIHSFFVELSPPCVNNVQVQCTRRKKMGEEASPTISFTGFSQENGERTFAHTKVGGWLGTLCRIRPFFGILRIALWERIRWMREFNVDEVHHGKVGILLNVSWAGIV